MFYLIGLGLNEKSLSLEALEICRKAEKIYLEGYTAEFPYETDKLEKLIGKRIIKLNREDVEGEKFISRAKKEDVILLVYGSPLMATTHSSIILKCREEEIPFCIIENASIFDAITETGMQAYKFGKTASMPAWKDDYKPASFADTIIDNEKIKAHTLILVDIGLSFENAILQLKEAAEKKKIKLDKIIVCSQMGTEKSKIIYRSVNKSAKEEIKAPFCFIITGELHFIERECLPWFEK